MKPSSLGLTEAGAGVVVVEALRRLKGQLPPVDQTLDDVLAGDQGHALALRPRHQLLPAGGVADDDVDDFSYSERGEIRRGSLS